MEKLRFEERHPMAKRVGCQCLLDQRTECVGGAVQADRQQFSVSSDGRFLMNTVKDDLAAPMTVTERLQIS
jgi:hypothetical protein